MGAMRSGGQDLSLHPLGGFFVEFFFSFLEKGIRALARLFFFRFFAVLRFQKNFRAATN